MNLEFAPVSVSRVAFSRGLTLVLVLTASLVASGGAFAQALIRAYYGNGVQQGAGFGLAIGGGADFDADGHCDVVVTDPGASSASDTRVYVYSGIDGHVLWTVSGMSAQSDYGMAVDVGVDIDGDGVGDVLVSSPNSPMGLGFSGLVDLRSGATGALIRSQFEINASGTTDYGNWYGYQVAFLDDVNGDGVPEYGIFGSYGSALPPPVKSKVWVYDGASGTLITTLVSATTGASLGWQMHPGNDIDSNGVGDYVISAPFENATGLYSGAVRVFEGPQSQVKYVFNGAGTGSYLGWGMMPVDDLDGDGVGDIACSSLAGALGVRVASTKTGQTLMNKPAAPWRLLGEFLDVTEDVDGDGYRDLMASDYAAPPPVTGPGRLLVFSTKTGADLFMRPDTYTPLQASGQYPSFPEAVQDLGDVDGDGRRDWAISCTCVQASPSTLGAVEILSRRPLYAHADTITPGKKSVPFTLSGGIANKGRPYYLVASMTGTSGIPLPNSTLPLSYDALFDASVLLANTTVFSHTFGTLGATDGRATATFNGSFLPPSTDGLTLYFAYAIYDANGDWSSNAEAVTIDLL